MQALSVTSPRTPRVVRVGRSAVFIIRLMTALFRPIRSVKPDCFVFRGRFGLPRETLQPALGLIVMWIISRISARETVKPTRRTACLTRFFCVADLGNETSSTPGLTGLALSDKPDAKPQDVEKALVFAVIRTQATKAEESAEAGISELFTCILMAESCHRFHRPSTQVSKILVNRPRISHVAHACDQRLR